MEKCNKNQELKIHSTQIVYYNSFYMQYVYKFKNNI